MRSLPPPRITYLRKWKRFRKNMKAVIKDGCLIHFPFCKLSSKNHKDGISIIKKSRFSSRLKKLSGFEFKNLVQGATAGILTASLIRKFKTGFPYFRKGDNKKSKFDVKIRI